MTKILLWPVVKKRFEFVGYNFERTTWFMNFYTTLGVFITLEVLSLGAMLVIFDEFTLNTFADAFESCGPNYELFCKAVITRFELKSIRYLLKQMDDKFWEANKFGPDVEKNHTQMYNAMKYSYRIYSFLMYTCGFTAAIIPLFLEKRRYPLASYNIVDVENNYFYVFQYSIQIFNFIYGINILLAMDGLFIVFILNVYCQNSLLQHSFESLKINELKTEEEEEICYQRLKKNVDHHNVILEFVEKLSELYSVQMLNQFIGNTLSICMGIYIFTGAGSDITIQFRAGLITVSFMTELVIYCMLGSILTQSCSGIIESMYSSGWEGNSSKRFRTACHIVIMRSQKDQQLKAGGLYAINAISLVSVLQTSFSFYTLMSKAKNGM